MEKLKELLQCQKDKKQKSCTPCSNFFTCKLRAEYVEETYKSMNKDFDNKKDGFNF